MFIDLTGLLSSQPKWQHVLVQLDQSLFAHSYIKKKSCFISAKLADTHLAWKLEQKPQESVSAFQKQKWISEWQMLVEHGLASLLGLMTALSFPISHLNWCCIRHQKPSRNSKETYITICTTCCSAAQSYPLCCEFDSAAAVTSCRPCSLSTYSSTALNAPAACIPVSQNDSRLMDNFPAKKVFRLHTNGRRPNFTLVGGGEREKQKTWHGNHFI